MNSCSVMCHGPPGAATRSGEAPHRTPQARPPEGRTSPHSVRRCDDPCSLSGSAHAASSSRARVGFRSCATCGGTEGSVRGRGGGASCVLQGQALALSSAALLRGEQRPWARGRAKGWRRAQAALVRAAGRAPGEWLAGCPSSHHCTASSIPLARRSMAETLRALADPHNPVGSGCRRAAR